ncbi:MAG TPA: polysaccharide biosynthesis tyrosine autokinase, partial [Chryseosolibacter sp.]
DLVMLLGEKSRFLAGQTENSPAVVEVSRKIAALNVAIQEALKNNIRSTNLLIGDLNSRIAKIQEQFGRLPRTEQDILNIKRKYSLNDNIYTYLLQRKAEASITLASNMPLNDIVEAAVPGVPPMMLRPMLNYFLAFMMGLIIPVAFIAVRETFSGKIRDLKEIEGKLVVPIVGSIGKKENGYWQMVVANHPKARISEAFRALRTNIDFIKPAEAPLTILVTSSIAGEGKSFCALNLASAFAACGKKTLVIICDMHKSFDSPGLELDNGPGLSDVLIGRTADVPAVIQRTGYKNLDIVVPGPVPPNPAELLIGERFQAMLDDLKNTYYVIVLDSSPVGLTNETLYLTRLASLTLFVLRQNYSDKDFVDDINALREKKGIENLYAVINDVEGRYLSYHRYGHGYYDDAPGKDSFLRKVGRFVSNKAAI